MSRAGLCCESTAEEKKRKMEDGGRMAAIYAPVEGLDGCRSNPSQITPFCHRCDQAVSHINNARREAPSRYQKFEEPKLLQDSHWERGQ